MADKPITRVEKYLACLNQNYAATLPEPITRIEKYLYELCKNGTGGATPEEIENAVKKYLAENPVSALDASTASKNTVPTADGTGEWSWKTVPAGPAGPRGKDGRGITSVTIKTDGHLQIDYSDGTNVDAGEVVGEKGLDGASGVPVRVEKTAADTVVELEPNKLYIFPEMASLTYTLATPADTSIANEYHFVFRSGATATELVHPANVSVPDGFVVDKNKIYEISILEGCLAYQSWAVSE